MNTRVPPSREALTYHATRHNELYGCDGSKKTQARTCRHGTSMVIMCGDCALPVFYATRPEVPDCGCLDDVR